jgi:hypothetical protein
MSSASDSPNTTRSESPELESPWPLTAHFDSEQFMIPYRTACKLLLETHHRATAIADINRKFFDECLSIMRREQDAMLDISEKMLHRLSHSEGAADSAETSESFTDFYESAIAGMREMSKAMTDAQARSIEALRDHMRATTQASAPPETRDRTAA